MAEFADIVFANSSIDKPLNTSEFIDWYLSHDLSDACPDSPGGIHGWKYNFAAGALTGGFCVSCMFCGMTAREYMDVLEEEKLSTLDSTTASSGISVTGFSASFVGYGDTSGPRYSLGLFASYYPSEFMSLLKSLGIADKVAVVAISRASPYSLIGVYWDEQGRLCQGSFTNPIGLKNASLYGVYSLSDLELLESCPCYMDSTSSSFNGGSLYYSKAYAEAMSNFALHGCAAMDWSGELSFGSDYDILFPGFNKSLSNTTWYSGSWQFYISTRFTAKFWNAIAPSMDEIVWDNSRVIVQPTNTDSTSRPASVTQIINNYNIDNSVENNTTNINYYIGTVDESNNVTNVYNINVYDEETLIFTEPVTGTQYQTTGWTYNYTDRIYSIDVEPGTLTYDGTDIDRLLIMYGDEELTICFHNGMELIGYDTYSYVAVSGSECSLYGHSYTYETAVEPTCTTVGERKYICSVCGDEYAEDIPILEHVYEVEQTTAPTCTKAGENLYTCTLCGNQYTEVVLPTEHAYTYSVAKPATCYMEGTAMYTCGTCGNQFTEPIPMTEHVSEIVETVPTEYDEDGGVISYGYTIYKCTLCGEEYTISDAPDVEDEGWFSWLGNQFKKLASALFGGFAEGIEYLTGTVIKSVTDLGLGLVEWLFGLLDVDILDSWYAWLDDDNEYFNTEFGTEVESVWDKP